MPQMKPPTVSVLIAAFQAEPIIHKAIRSVLATSNTEVVIAPDDGSLIYKALELQYGHRVKVLTPSYRTGPSQARNRAFKGAAGAFITMLDADDYFAEQAITEALSLAAQTIKGVAFFRTVYIYENTGLICRELPAKASVSFDEFVHFHGSIHALYKRDMWQDYGDFLAEDVLVDAEILLANQGAAPLTTSPYYISMHPSSITAQTQQAVFNGQYQILADQALDPQIKHLFQEKLAAGKRYEQALVTDPKLLFQDFVKGLGLPCSSIAT